MAADLDLTAKFNGGFLSGIAKKFLGGESLFINEFRNNSNETRRLTLVQKTPGEIRQVELDGGSICLQPGAYVASTPGLTLGLRYAGISSFIGREGSGTGRPGDGFLLDDLIKNAKEAESRTNRNDIWNFFTRVANTRIHAGSWIIIIMTRWSDDDLIARLTDPKNPYYRESVAKQWTVINIPAIMDNEAIAKALGKNVGDALWPERFPLDLLATAREMDPMGFSALQMGRPTPPEGAFYKQNDIYEYHKPDEFPQNARMYQTGDLAVSTEITADKSAVGTWGLDEHDVLWLHPDLYWERRSSDESVDEIIDRGKQYKIMEAFFEKGQLEKAIGPFLEKRMTEEKAYFTVTPMSVSGNKGMKSLSIRGRMRQGKVRFPAFAPWWPAAKEQLLKFTGSGSDKEDDFCDMVALIGQALDDTIAASKPAGNVIKMPKVGTLAWVKYASDRQKQHEWRMKMRRGM